MLTVTINADGTLVYTGNTDFSGIDTITYTVSDGNGGETIGSVEVLPALIQAKNATLVSKAQASIIEYGEDYTGGDTDKLIKYEIWIDASALSMLNASATEVWGYEFDMDVDPAQVSAFDFNMIAGDNFGFNAANPNNSTITFNSELGSVAMASSGAIIDIDASNDGAPSFVGSEKLIGTFYVSPTSDLETMKISVKDVIIVTDAGNIESGDYVTELEVSSIYATIQTDATNYLDNISLHYFKDGLDTGISTLVENGEIIFPDISLEFDAVKLSNPAAYTHDIAADDAVDILRDIVHLDELVIGSAAWHSADVDNDGQIAADDAVDILRHVVRLDMIDTFDLIDNTTGNRITSLDANAIDVGQWSIIANGDVDQSGRFDDAFVMYTDIV